MDPSKNRDHGVLNQISGPNKKKGEGQLMKSAVSGVQGFSFARGQRPYAKLNRVTDQGRKTVAAKISFWSVDSDIGGSTDQALGSSPAHDDTLPWAGAV